MRAGRLPGEKLLPQRIASFITWRDLRIASLVYGWLISLAGSAAKQLAIGL